MAKFEMHVHTAECDKVAKVGGADIVRMYQDAGYSGLVITDHYFSLFFEWFQHEFAGESHKDVIDRWLKGYYAARNEGEKRGFTVLSGAEVRFDGTINDYLLYGVEPEFFYQAPLLNRLKGLDELLQVLPKDVCVVQAHPFRDNMTVIDPSRLFGIEAHNGGTDCFRNQLAEIYADHYKKSKTSGSDFHKPMHLAKGGICTQREIKTSQDLISILRSGEYSLIK